MSSPKPGWRYRTALWIDKWVGPVLCASLIPLKALRRSKPSELGPENVRKVLVIKMWGMGSIVLASPLLQEIEVRFPDARVDFLTLKENLDVLELLPHSPTPIAVDLSGGIRAFLWDALRVLHRVRRERYDLLLDLEFFTRFSALFSFVAGARRTCGFSSKGSLRGRLHDSEIPFNTYHHVVLNFLSLLRSNPVEPLPEVDLAGPSVLPQFVHSERSLESLEGRLTGDPAWRGKRPIVVLNPNAGDMALERRWPPDRVVEFLKALCEAHDVDVVLVGSSAEREFVDRIVRNSGLESRIVNLAGETDLGDLVALFSLASVVVTNDSGTMHIAAATGASTVALFGPETPFLYRPLRVRREQRHIVHYRRLACSPCMFVHDNKVLSCWFADALCMRGIAPDQVLASVGKLLAEDAAR
jgi:lipopolysaccharide heptosyltransferase II